MLRKFTTSNIKESAQKCTKCGKIVKMALVQVGKDILCADCHKENDNE